MVRFLGRDVVKHGHVKDYMAACKALNDAAPNVGMPPIRVYESKWGTWNEVFWEQEFEDRPISNGGSPPPTQPTTRSGKRRLTSWATT